MFFASNRYFAITGQMYRLLNSDLHGTGREMGQATCLNSYRVGQNC